MRSWSKVSLEDRQAPIFPNETGGDEMTIEERFEKLEQETGRLKRRNRWLLGAIVLIAGSLVIPILFETTASRARAQAGGAAKDIRAKSIVIEDENGKVRAKLSVTKDKPALLLYDENEKASIILGATKEGPTLALCDNNGKVRAWLIAHKDGPLFEMYDGNEKVRVGLKAVKDGTVLILYDENEKVRVGLAESKDGPMLELYDENGRDRFKAGKTKIISQDGKTITNPESSLILLGPDGKVIWSAIK